MLLLDLLAPRLALPSKKAAAHLPRRQMGRNALGHAVTVVVSVSSKPIT